MRGRQSRLVAFAAKNARYLKRNLFIFAQSRWNVELGTWFVQRESSKSHFVVASKFVAHVVVLHRHRNIVRFLRKEVTKHQFVNGNVGVNLGRFSINLWAKNLLDKKYVSSVIEGSPNVQYNAYLGERLTFGLTAKLKY